jgi:hypothetical protein
MLYKQYLSAMSKTTPGVLWNEVNNRPAEMFDILIDDLHKRFMHHMVFLYEVFRDWKNKIHGYELRELAHLGKFREYENYEKKRFWRWHYNQDDTVFKRWTQKLDRKELRRARDDVMHLKQFEMDFVYLDEI